MSESFIEEKLLGFDRALTPEDLARIWQLSVWTIREWIRKNRLPAYQMGTRRWRIDPIEAVKFWRQRRRKP
jgi:excisionase family DNA binding protein